MRGVLFPRAAVSTSSGALHTHGRDAGRVGRCTIPIDAWIRYQEQAFQGGDEVELFAASETAGVGAAAAADNDYRRRQRNAGGDDALTIVAVRLPTLIQGQEAVVALCSASFSNEDRVISVASSTCESEIGAIVDVCPFAVLVPAKSVLGCEKGRQQYGGSSTAHAAVLDDACTISTEALCNAYDLLRTGVSVLQSGSDVSRGRNGGRDVLVPVSISPLPLAGRAATVTLRWESFGSDATESAHRYDSKIPSLSIVKQILTGTCLCAGAVVLLPMYSTQGTAHGILAPSVRLSGVRIVSVSMASSPSKISSCVDKQPCLFITESTILYFESGSDPSLPAQQDMTVADVIDTGSNIETFAEEDRYESLAESKVIDLLRLPLEHASLFGDLHLPCPKGILLHGAPGVGKSWSVRRAVEHCGASLITTSAAELMSPVPGESECRLRAVFEEARKRADRCAVDTAFAARSVPVVLFIDEIDVVCPKRNELQAPSSVRLVAQLLTLMDGMMSPSSTSRLVVIGATNYIDSIDPALRRSGRFDREINLLAPTRDERIRILKHHVRNMPLARCVKLDVIAEACVGFVGADLASLCRAAALEAVRKRAQSSSDMEDAAPIITAEHFAKAMLEVSASSRRNVDGIGDDCRSEASASRTTWGDIGGLPHVKRRLQELVEWPRRFRGTFRALGLSPARGILLFGPPGCGKTTVVRAMAASGGLAFFHLSGAEVYSSYVGEAERGVRAVFKRARANTPCVVFFDELDSIVSGRQLGGDSGSGVETRVLATLLNEMDGITVSDGVVVVAATNRPDMLDAALLRPGRLEQSVYVPPPDEPSRRAILSVYTKNMPLARDVNVEDLVVLTSGQLWSGADLRSLCREAALLSLRSSLNAKEVMRVHFEEAVARMCPSLREGMLLPYVAFAERQVRKTNASL